MRGVIDFHQARLLDPAWWRRCRILLNGMQQEEDLTVARSVFDYHLALVGNAGLTEDSFKGAQERARRAYQDILGVLRPWEGSAEDRKKQEYQALRDAYVAHFGDPSDPVWQEEYQRQMDAWLKQREEAEANSEPAVMERIMQRIKARDLKYQELRYRERTPKRRRR